MNPDPFRTVAEVEEQRRHAVTGGCCDRFADHGACDCLAVAAEYERSLLVEGWNKLVPHLTELESLYREEAPTGKTPKLYERMKELLEEEKP